MENPEKPLNDTDDQLNTFVISPTHISNQVPYSLFTRTVLQRVEWRAYI